MGVGHSNTHTGDITHDFFSRGSSNFANLGLRRRLQQVRIRNADDVVQQQQPGSSSGSTAPTYVAVATQQQQQQQFASVAAATAPRHLQQQQQQFATALTTTPQQQPQQFAASTAAPQQPQFAASTAAPATAPQQPQLAASAAGVALPSSAAPVVIKTAPAYEPPARLSATRPAAVAAAPQILQARPATGLQQQAPTGQGQQAKGLVLGTVPGGAVPAASSGLVTAAAATTTSARGWLGPDNRAGRDPSHAATVYGGYATILSGQITSMSGGGLKKGAKPAGGLVEFVAEFADAELLSAADAAVLSRDIPFVQDKEYVWVLGGQHMS